MEIIKASWLGKLIGKVTEIRFDESELLLFKGSNVISQHRWSEFSSFPNIKKGFFSSKISFLNHSSLSTVSFLKATDVFNQISKIESCVASQIQQGVEQQKLKFLTFAIDEYLRDTNIEPLNNSIVPVLNAYQLQKDAWEKNIDASLIEFLDTNKRYFPLDEGAALLREQFERRTLEARDRFYSKVESNPLTQEQRLAVIRDNDKNLVLAAAGTGKTSVMVAKALDLIDRKVTTPDKILILAYNKAAAAELNERLLHRSSKLGMPEDVTPKIMTFHALGRNILSYAKESVRMSKFTEDPVQFEIWLSKWFVERIKNDEKFMKNFIDLSYQPINPFDFKTKEEYDAYIRDNEYRTLQGERVKGYQELLIANWLFLNGIEYAYEPKYVTKRRIEIGFDYSPDFYLKDADVYLEHFGISRDGSTRPDIDMYKYNQEIISKRQLHQDCGTHLIETYHYNWVEGKLESVLEQHIATLHIEVKKRSLDEIFEQLKESGFLIKGIKRYLKCLQAIRVEQLDNEGTYNRLQEQKIKNADKYTELLGNIHSAYVNELSQQNAIDFDDMIIKATHFVSNENYKPEWTHILVDEFQDISGSRMLFLNQLIEKGDSPRLTVVGDDWQSIYRFSGGKLELTTQFTERVGSCSTTMLQKTFRYNNSIADIAGNFVMQNPEQYKKNVVTHTKVDSSQVYLLDSKVNGHENLSLRTAQIIQKIIKNDPDASIAVLARYRYLLEDAKAVVTDNGIKQKIKYWTFHGSKGLEADYCVLIGFFQGKTGFPNQNKEEAVVEALLPSLDTFPHSEERRLLYVGITRAKKKSYLIADPMATSEFIVELLSPKYGLHIASPTFEEQYRKMFKCPICSTGHFKMRNGKFGSFYSCTSGEVCNAKPRVCKKCGAPSVDSEHVSRCTNLQCAYTIKICEKCGRPMKLRQGKYSDFWGCTGYGIKEDQCRNTAKVSSFLGIKFE